MVEQRTSSSEARDRVIDAAHSLFTQRGFADVSMQQIADGASITKATLYHHFRDKQDLFLAAMRFQFTQNHNQLVESFLNNTDLCATIREMLVVVIEGKRTDPQRLMSDFHQHVDVETQQRFWTEFPKPWHLLEPVVQSAIERGEISDQDAVFVARFLYGAVAGFAHIARMAQDSDKIEEATIQHFTDTILHGLSRR